MRSKLLTHALRLSGRYLIPVFLRSIYYSIRFRCLVSLRADIQLSPFIRLGKGTDIRPFARVITTDGRIELGRGCGLNSFVFISAGSAPILIGDDVRIGPHTSIIASNRLFDDRTIRMVDQPKQEKGITIGSDVWIGANVVILDGVTIGGGSVIGAGSVVNKDIPTFSVALGNPAKVIRERGHREMSEPPRAVIDDRHTSGPSALE